MYNSSTRFGIRFKFSGSVFQINPLLEFLTDFINDIYIFQKNDFFQIGDIDNNRIIKLRINEDLRLFHNYNRNLSVEENLIKVMNDGFKLVKAIDDSEIYDIFFENEISLIYQGNDINLRNEFLKFNRDYAQAQNTLPEFYYNKHFSYGSILLEKGVIREI